jgi:hypothetical protein
MTQEEDKGLLKFLREQEAKGYIQTLYLTIRLTVLLHPEEGWQITTGTRLPAYKRYHDQQSIPLATHHRAPYGP